MVNQLPAAVRAIDQYAIVDDDRITGGFTLAIAGDEALMLGFHSEREKGTLLWVFREIRRLYPAVTTLVAYRATGKGMGRRAWVATRTGWYPIREKPRRPPIELLADHLIACPECRRGATHMDSSFPRFKRLCAVGARLTAAVVKD